MWAVLILCYVFWDKISLLWEFLKMLWRKNSEKSSDDKILTIQYVTIDIFSILYEYTRVLLKLNLSSNLVHTISGKEIEVEYLYSGKPFRFRTKIKRGPNKYLVKSVYDNSDVDVTDKVKQYLGPGEDWHGHDLTVKQLGFESLKFILNNDKEVVCDDKLLVME